MNLNVVLQITLKRDDKVPKQNFILSFKFITSVKFIPLNK